MPCGPELAVPATKSFTATVLVLLALLESVQPNSIDGLDDATAILDSGLRADVELVVEHLSGCRSALITGRGPTLPAALEGALKLVESAGLWCTGMGGNDLKHGWMAGLGADVPVVLLDAGPRLRDRWMSLNGC